MGSRDEGVGRRKKSGVGGRMSLHESAGLRIHFLFNSQ